MVTKKLCGNFFIYVDDTSELEKKQTFINRKPKMYYQYILKNEEL